MLTTGTDKRYTLLAVASGGLAAAEGAQCRPLTPRRNSAQDRCDAAIRWAIQAGDRTLTAGGRRHGDGIAVGGRSRGRRHGGGQRARHGASGHVARGHDRPHQRRRRRQLHRHCGTRRAGREGGRGLPERVRRRPRGPQDRPVHLREPVDAGRRPDLRQRHGPEGRRRRRRTLHRAGPDRGADHHRGRHPLHHDQRGVDRRAHHARQPSPSTAASRPTWAPWR